MLRVTGIVAVGLLMAVVAHASVNQQGQVVSYYKNLVNSGDVIVASVPTGGFVLTDVVIGVTNVWVDIVQYGGTPSPDYRVSLNNMTDTRPQSFLAGIPFDEGTEIRIEHGGGGAITSVTLSGYIPSAGGAIAPAVGNVGLGMLAVFLLGAGGYAMSKRNVAA